LVGEVTGWRYIVLHLGPVHNVSRPPETGYVVDVVEHDLLKLDDELPALGGIEPARLPRIQVVDARVGEPAPVLRGARDERIQQLIGIVDKRAGRLDHQLEVPRIPSVREPGRRLER